MQHTCITAAANQFFNVPTKQRHTLILTGQRWMTSRQSWRGGCDKGFTMSRFGCSPRYIEITLRTVKTCKRKRKKKQRLIVYCCFKSIYNTFYSCVVSDVYWPHEPTTRGLTFQLLNFAYERGLTIHQPLWRNSSQLFTRIRKRKYILVYQPGRTGASLHSGFSGKTRRGASAFSELLLEASSGSGWSNIRTLAELPCERSLARLGLFLDCSIFLFFGCILLLNTHVITERKKKIRININNQSSSLCVIKSLAVAKERKKRIFTPFKKLI